MTDGPLLRLLEMVQRELGADDARVEIGGKAPDSDQFVWVRLSETRRVVAFFETPPLDPDGARERLLALVEAFSGTATSVASRRGRPPGALTRALLNEQLGMLAERLDALRVVVIDDGSPVVWGSSDPFQRSESGVEEALRTARVAIASADSGLNFIELLTVGLDEAERVLTERGVDRSLAGSILREIDVLRAGRIAHDPDAWSALVLTTLAIAQLRNRPMLHAVQPRVRRVVHEDGFGLLAKPFASSYWLVSVFDRQFSELRVEGTIVRVLPRIERLVLALPPVDPPPLRARVVPLHRDK